MKSKIVLPVVIAAFVLSSACGGGNSGGLTINQGVLSIGIEIGYPPMEYYAEDGKTPAGFDVDLGKAIAGKLGLEANFIDTPWDGIFTGVNNGRYDCIISSVTINPARLEVFDFSKPYISNTLAMVVLKGSPVTARSPAESAGLNIAFQSETTSEEYMEDLASGGLSFIPRSYEKVIFCFDEIMLGRVDAIITDLLVAYDYVSSADSPFEIVWTNPDDERFGVCLKKGNDALTSAIDRALDELYADGTLHKISHDVFGMDLVTAARN